jgi:alkylhydroperoxidase family enzyme
MPDPPPRIPQLGESEWTDDAREVFGALGGIRTGRTGGSSAAEQASQRNHVLRTFAQHPALTKPFLQFNGYLLSPASTLPVRLRQIAIHRVAWVRGCPYMWSSHLRVSLPLGLARDDFEAIKVGESATHWSELEQAVVGAVDALVDESQVSDETWDALTAHLDHRQMMDLLFTVGCYTMLTMVFNTLRIEREPELQELAADYGAPERASYWRGE